MPRRRIFRLQETLKEWLSRTSTRRCVQLTTLILPLDRTEQGLTTRSPSMQIPQRRRGRRTRSRLGEANESYDAAVDRHSAASAAHWAEVNGYRDAVKANLIRIIPSTNSGRGFSDADYRWLASEYPQFSVTRGEVEAGAVAGVAAAATVGAAASAIPETPTGAVVGGAGAAAAMSMTPNAQGNRRTLMMVGGGVLGMLMLFVVFIVLSGDSTTPGELKTVPQELVEEAPESEQSAIVEPEPVTEVEVSEPVAEEPVESESSTGTTPPQIPASLAGAKIIEIKDLGFGCYQIIFEGDTEGDGSAESISQSVLFFQASVHILSDGVRVSGTYLVNSGEARATAVRVDDADSNKTDHGKGDGHRRSVSRHHGGVDVTRSAPTGDNGRRDPGRNGLGRGRDPGDRRRRVLQLRPRRVVR